MVHDGNTIITGPIKQGRCKGVDNGVLFTKCGQIKITAEIELERSVTNALFHHNRFITALEVSEQSCP